MTDPSSPTGSPGVCKSWARRLPPSAVGGVIVPPTPPGGSPQGFTGEPNWPESGGTFAPSPPLAYRLPSGPNCSAPTEWVVNWLHQSLTSTRSAFNRFPLMVRRDSRPLVTQPSTFGPGGVGQVSCSTPGVPHVGAVSPIGAS